MATEIMCGILGIASQLPVTDRDWITAGRDAMQHRGPDDSGEWWSDDGRVGLAHRRLAIIDLSAAGHQPMQHARGGLRITFNGEIYNFEDLRSELTQKGHTFQSHSDTEVILAAYHEWGTDCLAKLNGMFAFALYDEQRETLFMARDRAGEKPLFYSLHKGGIRFASELKGLMADPDFSRQINPEALDCYLAMGFVPGEYCMLQGVNKLPPAHAMIFDLQSGDVREWRYWQLPDLTAESADETTLLHELEALLEDSVRRQLVSDVPLGILLSGGVDSSLITAMAARVAPAVKTFTVSFRGHDVFDETDHARLIANEFGTEHLELDAAEATVDLLPKLAWQLDEPMVDSSIIPTFLLSQLVHKHCTVALGGDGGDELFGGYPHYDRLLWLQKNVGPIPRPLRQLVSSMAGSLMPVGMKGRNWFQSFGADFRQGLPLVASFFDPATRRKLMPQQQPWPTVAGQIRDNRIGNSSDLLQRATRMDFENYLAEDILVKVDRASMLNSLEVRAPLLDYRLIEFAYGKVPSQMKATPASRKILLKNLAERVLPATFDRQRKQGFSIPLSAWLKSGSWLDFFRNVLLDSGSAFFGQEAVRNLLDGQAKGRSNTERLFGLVMFELWRREYQIGSGKQ